LTDLNTI